MSYAVVYAPEFRETLTSVYNFIQNKFGDKPADKFIKKAEKTISLIAEQPFMFKSSPIDENVRVGLITKQTSLFYRVTQTEIHLLFLWDNRQESILSE